MKTRFKAPVQNKAKTTTAEVRVDLPGVKLDLYSKNPSIVLKTLDFLFTRSVLTDVDKRTVKLFAKTSVMNKLVVSTYAVGFIRSKSLPELRANNNTLLAFKFLPKQDKENFYGVLAEVASFDLDARLLAASLLNKGFYNWELVEALYYADFRTNKVEELHSQLLDSLIP